MAEEARFARHYPFCKHVVAEESTTQGAGGIGRGFRVLSRKWQHTGPY